MNGKELYALLQRHFPNEAALSWDNVGLLCGRMDKDIRTVYIALDATTDVVDGAVEAGADLLLTHHPVIFSGIKRIEEGDYLGERLLRMIENHVACYAMHTNYDVKRMADLVVSRMGLKNPEVLEATAADGSEGIGYTGDFETPMTLETCALKIKAWFHIPDVRVYGDLNQKIQRVSVCPGSAKGMEDFALAQGGQVLIGGDFGHHEGLDCLEKHIAVIVAGHYGLEHVFIDDMAGFFTKYCPEIKVCKSKIVYPFRTM